LVQANISHEILVINDCSKDNTEEIVLDLKKKIKSLNCIKNYHPQGFGYAVRCGLSNYKGDSVCIFMADESDSPKDVIAFYHKLQQGFDCVFGSRFIKNGKLINYPFTKKILNRLGNLFIRILFLMKYNDTTNAFKMFRRHVIDGIQPILACHFNLTVELPLKAIVRGYKYAVLPNSWSNRKKGKSKFLIREIGSRYLFIIFYCLIEKLFSKNDYIKKDIND
jgi:dolichol-phosphate mannosyltransferase